MTLADSHTTEDEKLLQDELINMLVAGRDTVWFKRSLRTSHSEIFLFRLQGHCLGPYTC